MKEELPSAPAHNDDAADSLRYIFDMVSPRKKTPPPAPVVKVKRKRLLNTFRGIPPAVETKDGTDAAPPPEIQPVTAKYQVFIDPMEELLNAVDDDDAPSPAHVSALQNEMARAAAQDMENSLLNGTTAAPSSTVTPANMEYVRAIMNLPSVPHDEQEEPEVIDGLNTLEDNVTGMHTHTLHEDIRLPNRRGTEEYSAVSGAMQSVCNAMQVFGRRLLALCIRLHDERRHITSVNIDHLQHIQPSGSDVRVDRLVATITSRPSIVVT